MFDFGRRGWPLLGLLVSAAAIAQAPLQDSREKSVRMVRTEVKPVIDGTLDEAARATAHVVDDLLQTVPLGYATPDERHEIFLPYDDDALHVGAKPYDNDPSQLHL
jgi:hypothetical protein